MEEFTLCTSRKERIVCKFIIIISRVNLDVFGNNSFSGYCFIEGSMANKS
jgi:hypothetical protein